MGIAMPLTQMSPRHLIQGKDPWRRERVTFSLVPVSHPIHRGRSAMSQENEPLESTRDSVLYLIDASVSMVESGALDLSLQAASDAIRATAKLGDSQYDAGVLIYNVTDTKNGVLVLLSLGEPRIEDLKRLMKLATDGSRRENTIKPGSPSSGAISSALRIAKAEVNKLRTRSLRRIVLITDDDDPCGGRAREIEVAQTFSTDLTEMQVAIFPIFIQSERKPYFNVDPFWLKLSYVPQSIALSRDWKVSMRPVDLRQLGSSFHRLVFSKSRRKMASFKGRLRLEALEIGIKGYNVVQSKPRRPAGFHVVYVRDDAGYERRELVSSTRKIADKWSGKEVDPSAVTRAFSLNSKHQPDVPVSEDQLTELRHFSDDNEAVYDTYGFVPVEAVPLWGHVGHSVLLVPSNESLQNSSRAFASLHRSMQRLQQVAVVTVTLPTGRHSPSLAGLLYAFDPAPPIYEGQRVPEPTSAVGLYFVPLPFADDVRQIPPHLSLALSNDFDALKGLLGTLVHKFRLESGFDPARFGNPRFAQFATVLESLALSLEMETRDEEGRIPKEQRDSTRPRYEKIGRNVGNLSIQIRSILDAFRESAEQREREDRLKESENRPPSKRSKRDHGDDLDIQRFKDALSSDTLDSFLVADLRWALKQLNGKVSATKKADLVEELKVVLSSL